MRRDEQGSAAMVVIAMLPLLIVVCAGVVQLGAVRVVASRIAAAADLATLAAVSDQDTARLVSAGTLRLASDAADVARVYFARNLEPLAAQLAVSPERAAADADVAVFPDPPATDPLTGARYERPTVRLVARVPVRTPAFGALLLPSAVTIDVRSVSGPR